MIWNISATPYQRRYGVQELEGHYITVTAVSRRFNKTKQHIRYLIRTGKLPAMKIADMWVIKNSDAIERWQV